MKVIADLCVIPLGVAPSLAPYVAACERVLREAGLEEVQLHANGTSVVGDWAVVAAAIEACHGAVHAMGCSRIHTLVKINSRTDRDQTLAEKVEAVESLLGS
ncbi:MAG: MTH1187 family thiamine-binding protein [Cyanobacteriota bacterium]|nr:MTH1187 family thiamine-binding protein [Cyanobacteriota bacterium]